ncbi:TPA: NAD-dependent epimerase/dehydratase family protein [Photobacterium damselae]
MKKILVTGAAGFIGKSLIRALVQNNYSVIALDICDMPESLIEYKEKISWHNCSYTDIAENKSLMNASFENLDCAFHLATTIFPAESKVEIERDCYENVYCTVEFISKLYMKGCKKVIYASSGGTVYGFNSKNIDIYFSENSKKAPMFSYGLTKSSCEEYLILLAKKYNSKGLSLRISNPYGEEQKLNGNQGVIPIFMNKINNNIELPIFGNINSKRDYIYIDDLISAFILSIDYEGDCTVFNVCSGVGYSTCEIINEIELCLNKKANIKQSSNDDKVNSVLLSNDLIVNEINWSPKIELSEGIKRLAIHHNMI